MKPNFTKSVYYALILSIVLHVALVIFLKILYKPQLSLVKDMTHFELSHVPSQRTIRTHKRKQYSPPKLLPVKQAQIVTEAAPPITSLPTISISTHQNLVTPLHSFSFPTPRNLGIEPSDLNSSVTSVNPGIASRPGIGGIKSRSISRSTNSQSFKSTVDDALPVVSDLPLPTVILARIGQHIVANRTTDNVDIVFIIDASGSMQDNINAVRSHLNRMTDLFHTAGLDYTIGIVLFRDYAGYNMIGWDFEVIPQTRSIPQIKKALAKVKCTGGEKAIDALIRATEEVDYRQNADVHFILITDEYVSGNYSAADVLTKIRNARIKVDVIGLDEPFQKFITRRTGGLWLPIASLGAH